MRTFGRPQFCVNPSVADFFRDVFRNRWLWEVRELDE